MVSSMQNPGDGLPLAHTPQSESVLRVNRHPVTWNAGRTLSRGSFSFQGPLTDPGCPPLLHKIMYTFHLAADKVAPLGEGTQTVLIAIAWVCVILGSLWLLGLSPLDITGQHVDWAPGCRSASLTTSNPSSRALSAWAASRLLDKCLRGCQSPFSPRVACLFAAPVPTWV